MEERCGGVGRWRRWRQWMWSWGRPWGAVEWWLGIWRRCLYGFIGLQGFNILTVIKVEEKIVAEKPKWWWKSDGVVLVVVVTNEWQNGGGCGNVLEPTCPFYLPGPFKTKHKTDWVQPPSVFQGISRLLCRSIRIF